MMEEIISSDTAPAADASATSSFAIDGSSLIIESSASERPQFVRGVANGDAGDWSLRDERPASDNECNEPGERATWSDDEALLS